MESQREPAQPDHGWQVAAQPEGDQHISMFPAAAEAGEEESKQRQDTGSNDLLDSQPAVLAPRAQSKSLPAQGRGRPAALRAFLQAQPTAEQLSRARSGEEDDLSYTDTDTAADPKDSCDDSAPMSRQERALRDLVANARMQLAGAGTWGLDTFELSEVSFYIF